MRLATGTRYGTPPEQALAWKAPRMGWAAGMLGSPKGGGIPPTLKNRRGCAIGLGDGLLSAARDSASLMDGSEQRRLGSEAAIVRQGGVVFGLAGGGRVADRVPLGREALMGFPLDATVFAQLRCHPTIENSLPTPVQLSESSFDPTLRFFVVAMCSRLSTARHRLVQLLRGNEMLKSGSWGTAAVVHGTDQR